MNEYNKEKINKTLVTLLIITIVLFTILKLIEYSRNNKYSSNKKENSLGYVYTKYENDKNNSKIPYINLNGSDVLLINNEIQEESSSYLQSNNGNKTVTYKYNQNKNILSVVLTYKDIDDSDRLVYNFKTYVFDLKNNNALLTDEEILKKFDITKKEVNSIMRTKMIEKYKAELQEGYLDQNECNYTCFLEMREINNYIDNANYYIENSSLVVYRAYNVFSIYSEEEFFTKNDFKFIIK